MLAAGLDPNDVLTLLNRNFTLNSDSIHPSDDYLGAKIK
jgi:hypothetical protein